MVIRDARPEVPSGLNDRAADIWEPLLALADLAGGEWPARAWAAAVGLGASATERSAIGALLLDIMVLFRVAEVERIFSRTLVGGLNGFGDRPWLELSKRQEMTELWLAQELCPYGVRPKTLRIGEARGKGYAQEDFKEVFARYIPRSEVEALKTEMGD